MKADLLPKTESTAAPGLGPAHHQHQLGPEQVTWAVDWFSQMTNNQRTRKGRESRW